MKRANVTLTNMIVSAAALAIASVVIWFGWRLWEVFVYVPEVRPAIRQEFEFTDGSPYVKAGESSVEVFTIYPKEGGYLHRIGFRNGDIIVSDNRAGFYRSLSNFSEDKQTMSITVVDGGDGPPLDKRRKREMIFRAKE